MLRWYWLFGTLVSVAGVVVVGRRMRALRSLVEGDGLAHDPLEAGFARERLASLTQLRRTAIIIAVLFAALSALDWLG